MKKSIIKLFVALIVLLTVCSPAFSDNARVTFVKGKAEVLQNDKWVQLNVGDTLAKADVVSTGFQSELRIEYGGSVISLGALSRMTFETLATSDKKDNVSVYLNTGAVRSKVTHTQEKRVAYTVKSPVAVASVRGTDFTFTAAGTITCNEGAVVVYPNMDNIGGRVRSASSNEKTSSETEEDASDEGSDDELAGDYGPANALTSADAITDNAPAGALVVSKNQTVELMTIGTTDTPFQTAEKEIEKTKNTVTSTAATQEAVVVGGSGSADAIGSFTNQVTPKGSLKATIEVQD